MKRRKFIKTLSATVAGSQLIPAPEFLKPQSVFGNPNFGAWTWVHGGQDRTRSEWLEQFSRIADAGFVGVLASGGETEKLSGAAHDAGLEFHRWVWILNRPGDEFVRDNHPEWFTLNRNLEDSLNHPAYVDYYKWVCPTRDPVREYIGQKIADVAREPGVDGVHLDYIRHADVILPKGLWSKYDLVQDQEYPEFDYCYCDVCREKFEALHGVDPIELLQPTEDGRWKQFRWDSITRLVNELADAVHTMGKPISAAVFPTPAMASLMVHQQWNRWNLDMFFPMLYNGFYEEEVSWIESAAREGLATLPDGKQLNSGVYLPDLDPGKLGEAIRGARNAGSSGVAMFEMGGLTDEHLEVVRREMV